MPRDLHPSVVAELSSPVIYPAWAFRGVFGISTVRLWTGVGALTLNSESYLGNGWFSDFDPAPEAEQLSAEGFRVTLSGVPSELVALILTNSRHNARGQLYFVMLNELGTVIGNPYLAGSGRLDVPELVVAEKEARITISYENSLLMLERAKGGRYTDQSQKNTYSADRGFEHVANLQDLRFTWGTPSELNSA